MIGCTGQIPRAQFPVTSPQQMLRGSQPRVGVALATSTTSWRQVIRTCRRPVNAEVTRKLVAGCIWIGRVRFAAVDIQEFYDTTLLDESKSVQQKTTETLQIVAKWEQTLTIAGSLPPQPTLQTEVRYRYPVKISVYLRIPCGEVSIFSRNRFCL